MKKSWILVGLFGLSGCTVETGSECGREVTINSPTCTAVGEVWEIEVNGRVVGPEATELSIAAAGSTDVATTCAVWSPDQRHTCVSHAGEGEEDNWMATLTFAKTAADQSFTIVATAKDAAGAECADTVTDELTALCH